MTQEEKQLLFRDLCGRLPRNEIVKDAVELTITNTSFIPLPKLNIKAGDKAKIIIVDSLQEEPKCIYNRTLDERKKFCKYCSAACSVRIEEEPASEDLEEEIDEEIDNLCELGCYMEDLAKGNSEGIYPLPDNVVKELRKFARHFAEWQKQQMMKDAVEGEVMYSIGTALERQYKVTSERIQMDGLHFGDKVKIIIVKPEQQ